MFLNFDYPKYTMLWDVCALESLQGNWGKVPTDTSWSINHPADFTTGTKTCSLIPAWCLKGRKGLLLLMTACIYKEPLKTHICLYSENELELVKCTTRESLWGKHAGPTGKCCTVSITVPQVAELVAMNATEQSSYSTQTSGHTALNPTVS